jgi:hypothetical protein
VAGQCGSLRRRRKGRLGLKRLVPTVGDRKIPNATPASLRSGMSRSSIQAETIVKVAKQAAQAAGDEPLGGFGPPFLTGFDELRSLMGQGREALRGIDAFGCLRSLRARSALDGVSWVQRGLVEIAVGHRLTACYEIRAVVCSLPRASLLLGAGFGLLSRGLRGLGERELRSVSQHRVHNDREATRQSDSRFAHR